MTPAGQRIFEALKAAGPEGLSVAGIAEAADVKPTSVKVLVHGLRAAGVPISSVAQPGGGVRGRLPGAYVLSQSGDTTT